LGIDSTHWRTGRRGKAGSVRCAAVSRFGVTAASIEVVIVRMSVNQQLRIKAPKKLLSMFAKATDSPRCLMSTICPKRLPLALSNLFSHALR